MIRGIAGLELAGADETTYTHLLGPALRAGDVQVERAGTTRLVLGCLDLPDTRRRLARRAVELTEGGLRIGGLELGLEQVSRADDVRDSPVIIDHVVIRTSSAERAVANYAGRLGLDLRLERNAPQWDSHLLFLRCGRSLLEVVEPTGDERHEGPDAVWGVAWRVPELDSAVQRLTRAGVDVSEPRDGRKPGSRVATVRDDRFGVPTLLIEQGTNLVTDR